MLYQCTQCPNGMYTPVADSPCVCLPGYIYSPAPTSTSTSSPTTLSTSCQPCAKGTVPSKDRKSCMGCGSPVNVFSLPKDILSGLVRTSPKQCRNSSSLLVQQYATQLLSQGSVKYLSSTLGTNDCVCPAGAVLVEGFFANQAIVQFPIKVCMPCNNGVTASTDPYQCDPCVSPKVLSGGSCVCPVGYDIDATNKNNNCVSQDSLRAVSAQTRLSSEVEYRNLDGSPTKSVTYASEPVQQFLTKASVGCWERKDQDCQALVNLCILQGYESSKSACSVYATIQSNEKCRGVACERPTTLPWLYYLRNPVQVLQRNEVVNRINLVATRVKRNQLRFYASLYSLDGTWIGNRSVTSELFLCDLSGEDIAKFFIVGVNSVHECLLNLGYFGNAPDTTFIELYYVDGDNMLPVPVMVDYGRRLPKSQLIDFTTNVDAMSRWNNQDPPRLVRRFVLYDNVAGSRADPSLPIEYVSYAKSVDLVVTVLPGQHIQIPFVYITYESKGVYNAPPSQTATNNTIGSLRSSVEVSLTWTMDFSDERQSIETALIVACCVGFFTAAMRTYGWLRRRQTAEWDMQFVMRMFAFLCSHLSFLFAAIIIFVAWWWYVVFKHQAEIEVVLMPDAYYLFPMLWAATSCSIVHVFYLLWVQVNSDIVFIDWERSRGDLVRDKEQAPISMWRSVTVANEFLEIQTERGWQVELVMGIVLLLLEGVGYISLSAAHPDSNDQTLDGTYSDSILRIGVSAFMWIITECVLYILERVFFYRFVTVHPVQQFVDLVTLSNISVLILTERQYGWYIHGRTLHPHADVSMKEFQENLQKEEEGTMPMRGVLVNNRLPCTTFEVFASNDIRVNLNALYERLAIENSKAIGQNPSRQQRRLFEVMTGQVARSRVLTHESLQMMGDFNAYIKTLLERATEEAQLKVGVHQLFDYPPNVLFTNTQLYADSEFGWSWSTLLGIDHFVFKTLLLLYLAIDYHLHHSFGAMAITYVLNIIIVKYRASQGQANMAVKLRFDDRFFI